MGKEIEWMCSICGTKQRRSESIGRPLPGNCPRKAKGADGKPKPHTWVKNRTY